jgi:hypothetical protein
VSNPPTAEELAELAQAIAEGRRFIIVHLYAQLQKNGWRSMVIERIRNDGAKLGVEGREAGGPTGAAERDTYRVAQA